MRGHRILTLAALLLLPGCATLQQLVALTSVDFSIDRVSSFRLAGIEIERLDSFSDLGFQDAARLALAVSREELPLDFDLHLLAETDPSSSSDARLVRLDWTLFLEERETVTGTFADETILPPGVPVDVPIGVSLNLIDFYQGSAQDLFELALSLAGQGGAPKEITLQALPHIETPLGPLQYPQPITIVSEEVGQ